MLVPLVSLDLNKEMAQKLLTFPPQSPNCEGNIGQGLLAAIHPAESEVHQKD